MKSLIQKKLTEFHISDPLERTVLEEAILMVFRDGLNLWNRHAILDSFFDSYKNHDLSSISPESIKSINIISFEQTVEKIWISIVFVLTEKRTTVTENRFFFDRFESLIPSLDCNHQVSFHPFFDKRYTLDDIYPIVTRRHARAQKDELIHSVITCKLNNPVLRDTFQSIIDSDKTFLLGHGFPDVSQRLEELDMCLNEGELLTYRSFTDILFWSVVDRIKKEHPHKTKALLRSWIAISKWIVSSHEKHPFFKQSKCLSIGLLLNVKLCDFIMKQYSGAEQIYLFHDSHTSAKIDSAISLNIKNPLTRSIIRQYLDIRFSSYTTFKLLHNFIILFEPSLGEYASTINSYKSFDNDSLFWAQVQFFCKDVDISNSILVNHSLRRLLDFYRALFELYPDYPFFENSRSLSKRVIHLYAPITKVVSEGYTFVKYTENMSTPKEDKILLLVQDFDEYSANCYKDDVFSMDFSMIPDLFYRNLVKEYVFSSPQRIVDKGSRQSLSKLFSEASFLIDPSTQKWRRLLVSDDGHSFRNLILKHVTKANDGTWSEFTAKHQLNIANRFFKWAEENGLTINSALFFNYFGWSLNSDEKGLSQSISDDDLIKIGDYLYEKSKESVVEMLVFIAFLLVLRTPLRLFDIVKLERNCLRTTHKRNSFRIETYSKSSRRFQVKKESYTVDRQSRDLVLYAIEITSSYRRKLGQSKWSEYIFIHESIRGIIPINTSMINSRVQEACEKCGLPVRTYRNLRKTRMNIIWEFASQEKGGDWIRKDLTHHQDLAVTRKHYLDRNREQIIGQLLGFNIGDRFEIQESQKKVLQNIPDKYNTNRFDTEKQLGKCFSPSEKCDGEVYLPCLLCKNFRTTPEFKKAFLAELSIIDALLDSETDIRHDKDDLLTKRKLICNYLVAINDFEKQHDEHGNLS